MTLLYVNEFSDFYLFLFINCKSFNVTTELNEKKNFYLKQFKGLLPGKLPKSFWSNRKQRIQRSESRAGSSGDFIPCDLALTKAGMYHSRLHLVIWHALLTSQNFSGISTFARSTIFLFHSFNWQLVWPALTNNNSKVSKLSEKKFLTHWHILLP